MSINGGTGDSTFVLDSSTTMTLAGNVGAGSHLNNVEHIDLRPASSTLTLTMSDVLSMNSTSHSLFVEGGSNDTVNMGVANWSAPTLITDSFTGLTYDHYTQGTAVLNIEHGAGIHLI